MKKEQSSVPNADHLANTDKVIKNLKNLTVHPEQTVNG